MSVYIDFKYILFIFSVGRPFALPFDAFGRPLPSAALWGRPARRGLADCRAGPPMHSIPEPDGRGKAAGWAGTSPMGVVRRDGAFRLSLVSQEESREEDEGAGRMETPAMPGE